MKDPADFAAGRDQMTCEVVSGWTMSWSPGPSPGEVR